MTILSGQTPLSVTVAALAGAGVAAGAGAAGWLGSLGALFLVHCASTSTDRQIATFIMSAPFRCVIICGGPGRRRPPRPTDQKRRTAPARPATRAGAPS